MHKYSSSLSLVPHSLKEVYIFGRGPGAQTIFPTSTSWLLKMRGFLTVPPGVDGAECRSRFLQCNPNLVVGVQCGSTFTHLLIVKKHENIPTPTVQTRVSSTPRVMMFK